MNRIRVLIVDDHELVRKGLRLMFRSYEEIDVVGEAEDGTKAIQSAIQFSPDIVLLDITMGSGLDGFLVFQALKEEAPEVKVIFLTMHDEEAYIRRAIELGVPGYMSKNSDPGRLVEGIRQVHQGNRFYRGLAPEEVLKQMFNQSKSSEQSVLTRRELEIVRLSSLGYSNIEIGRQLNISSKTVENHKGRVMNKLQIRHRHELVQFAIKNRMIDL
ncbi:MULTISPECIES: response regulator transcription factor [Exiguobacterium]|uniref:response regulator n=1 Tax=Exiguobacterium TaxID=33986 RepID=UPI000877793C|nr:MULTISPECIES: response regulator transcription factor [Exiguobacterium]TCI25373.1 response regulator transcription factor [Exiguobacterium sp. SH5S4]TCI56223.1 response regulator transcription factor [Exiguobacterium sp. SH5S13]TCI61839.1 response regulator transcription factor [Exiguobacterium sp. SH3S1]